MNSNEPQVVSQEEIAKANRTLLVVEKGDGTEVIDEATGQKLSEAEAKEFLSRPDVVRTLEAERERKRHRPRSLGTHAAAMAAVYAMSRSSSVRGLPQAEVVRKSRRTPRIIEKVFRQQRRNDPCPCGSSLKYKKCHGKAAPDARLPMDWQDVLSPQATGQDSSPQLIARTEDPNPSVPLPALRLLPHDASGEPAQRPEETEPLAVGQSNR